MQLILSAGSALYERSSGAIKLYHSGGHIGYFPAAAIPTNRCFPTFKSSLIRYRNHRRPTLARYFQIPGEAPTGGAALYTKLIVISAPATVSLKRNHV
jgi:hypothetical protein